jgi:hypothetical protein
MRALWYRLWAIFESLCGRPMGILDDAIREHLDLKRKHGAQDAEVQQLEDEAFGPPARPGEPDFPERPPAGELPEEEVVAADAATEEGEPDYGPPEPEPLADAGPLPAEAEEPAFFDQDEAEASALDDLGPAPAPEPAAEPEAIVGEPTVEHPAPLLEPEDEEFEEFREPGVSEEEGEEDVLEETPEFLRDTPENERLWFEQGEPQDFDFDDEDDEDRPA